MAEILTQKRFKCVNCIYQTNRRHDLKRHLNAVHKVIDIDKLEFLLGGANVNQNEKNVNQKKTNVNQNEKNVNQNEKNVNHNQNICKKCNKIYKVKKCLIEHEKKCKGIDELTCPRCMISFSSRQAKYLHIKRDKCKPRSIIHARQNNNDNITNNIETQNIINNNIQTQNNNNIINNNNIYINNYGSERLDYLNYEKLLSIFTNSYDIPRLLTKEIHFNKDFPENNNIQYKNETNALIKNDDEFILKDLNLLAEELVSKKTSQMQRFAIENKEDICLKIENDKYYEIIDLLLNFILLKEPQEHYKTQIKNIKDMIKNNKN